jgi:PAS domain S-box-containing protein
MPGSTIDEQLRQLADSLDVALILRDLDPPRYVYVSSAFERIFGYPLAELLADPLRMIEYAHPDDRAIVQARADDETEGPTSDVEWRTVRPDGSVRWVRAKRSFVAADAGVPARIAGVIEDITDEKLAVAELARSREWLDALSEAVPIGFAIRDSETQRYAYVSAAYEQIFGRPLKDFYDDPAATFSLIHPDDHVILNESFMAARSGEPWSYEARIVRPDGETRWLTGHHVTSTGTGRRWRASTVEDVTDRRAREAQLRSLVDANIVGIMIAGHDRVYDANDAYLEIVGYTRADLDAGLVRWQDLTPPDWLAVTEAAAEEMRRTGSCVPYEKEFVRKDGNRVSVIIGSAVLEREPFAASSFVLDLTAIKQVEFALRQAEAEAQRANDAKSAFLSRMSHELRTPLNAVIGFGQLLALDSLPSSQQESVAQILKGGHHLLALINEVLDISRIDSGDLALSLERVLVADVVDETLGLVRHLGGSRRITVTDRCPPRRGVHVRADRQRLKQAVLNLLSNAIKYNREDGTVAVHCEPVGDTRVRLVVTDNGIGIPQRLMARLFEPFDRLGAEQTDIEGTGLGLALTKRLVEAMGGTVGATSVAGEGSTFWIELDLAAPDDGVELEQPTAPALPEPVGSAHLLVLYIEDNLANVRLVQRILARRPGIETLTAMQASLGIELARIHHPDLILLDLNLPDMPGVEALRRLRADAVTANIPVVVISADATASQIARLTEEGAADYLPKPFDIQEFLAVIDQQTNPAAPSAG